MKTNLMESRGQSFSAMDSPIERAQARMNSTPANKIILLSILFSALASGQAFRVDPTPAFTVKGSTPPGAYPAVLAIPGAIITLANYPAPTPATAYADYTGANPCPAGSPVVAPGASQCSSRSGPDGQFGFWLTAGNYQYTITLPNGSQTFGPFPLSVGGGGGVTLPSTTDLLSGNGTGGASDSGIAPASVVTLTGTQSLTNKTVDAITPTIFSYLANITSDVQAQFAGKQGTITTGTTAQYFRGDLSLATFPAFQAPISLTTTGTGAATFGSNILNVPTPSPISGQITSTPFTLNSGNSFTFVWTTSLGFNSAIPIACMDTSTLAKVELPTTYTSTNTVTFVGSSLGTYKCTAVTGGGATGATGPPGPINTIQNSGTPVTQRANLNFIPGTTSAINCVDNSGAGSTDCTVKSGLTFISSQSVSSVSSITFSSIPAGKKLVFDFRLKSNLAGSAWSELTAQLNGDTGSNYSYLLPLDQTTGSTYYGLSTNGGLSTRATIGIISSSIAGVPANDSGGLTWEIFDYANTATFKSFGTPTNYCSNGGSGVIFAAHGAGNWNGTAAVVSVVFGNGGNLMTGTVSMYIVQ